MLVHSLALNTFSFSASINRAVTSLNEPPDGKAYFMPWLQTDGRDGDRPQKFIDRLGFKPSGFQYGQNLPVGEKEFTFPIEQIEQTNTDAIVYLTVFPKPSPESITDAHIEHLALQCGKMNERGRRVLLRFGPEMNGNWNQWGQRPTMFIALWKKVRVALKKNAPLTAMVWAPSSGNGYPYPIRGQVISRADMALMDTNKNGKLDAGDDPYAPFYPGDDEVDWVGMSVYHFGTKWPWIDNVLPIPDQFHTFFTNRSDFYTDYAVKLNKPMMIAETAAAFHTNSTISVGPGELAIKQAWWRQFLTNATYLNLYPKIKLYSIFEIVKHEGVTHRDFAITLKPNILQAFKTDFQQVEGFFVEANSTTSQNAGLTGEVVDYSKSGASCTSPMMSILMSMIYFMIL